MRASPALPSHVAVDARVLGGRGAGRYLSNLLRAMSAMDAPTRFTLFTLDSSQSSAAPRHPRFEIVNLGSAHPALAEQWLIPRLAAKRGAQLIHYPDNSGALRPGLPMVLTMHDSMWRRPLGEALLYPTWRQRLQDRYRKFVCPRAAAAAAKVITVSEFSAHELRQSLGLGSKLEVVLNGLDQGFDAPLPQAALRRALKGLGLEGRYLFCSGAADRRKNISALIRAFALSALKGVDLVVSSMRPGEMETTDYLQAARDSGVEGRVKFLGFVSEEELKALYQGCLAYVFPSLWEGFGLPVLEAFAMGSPVLCSNAGALPEVAGKGALMVDPRSLDSMASGLRSIVRARRAAWAAKGRRELRRFSWDMAAARTMQIYAQALRGAGA
jgi:glycosyltransferase involved in cell wall biosynthesis